MDKAKIRLSPKEAELVINTDWILTKNEILRKAKYLLEDVQVRQQQFFLLHPAIIPEEVVIISPKISKGENYKGLPYLVLDYPRWFDRENHFAVRCMFWWGNFFSITLHLSGLYKIRYADKIENILAQLKEDGYFISISQDQWEHHFETGNYRPVHEMGDAEFKHCLKEKDFLKLAKKFPLKQWDDAGDLLFASFCQILNWLGD